MVDTTVVQHTNYALAAVYLLLCIASVAVIRKGRNRCRKATPGLIFVVQILLHAAVRFSFFCVPEADWLVVLDRNFGVSYMVFIDLLPELLFAGLYLLMVVSWGCVWLKSRGLTPLTANKTLTVYFVLMGVLFVSAAFLAIAAHGAHKHYNDASDWEAIYLCVLSSVAVISAVLLGIGVRVALQGKAVVDFARTRFMRRLTFLIGLTVISFVLKGFWAMFLSDFARRKWIDETISGLEFAILWFFYYFVSEVLPESVGLYFQVAHKQEGKPPVKYTKVPTTEQTDM